MTSLIRGSALLNFAELVSSLGGDAEQLLRARGAARSGGTAIVTQVLAGMAEHVRHIGRQPGVDAPTEARNRATSASSAPPPAMSTAPQSWEGVHRGGVHKQARPDGQRPGA